MRRTTVALVLALLITAAAGDIFVRGGKANPISHGEGWMWIKDGEVPIPEDMDYPKVIFSSPANNVRYAIDSIPLVFNVSEPQRDMFCWVDYKGSWQSNSTHVQSPHANYVSVNLTNVPEGSHYILVTANLEFVYQSWLDTTQKWITHYTSYNMSCSGKAYFNVEAASNDSTVSPSERNNQESGLPSIPQVILILLLASALLVAIAILIAKKRSNRTMLTNKQKFSLNSLLSIYQVLLLNACLCGCLVQNLKKLLGIINLK